MGTKGPKPCRSGWVQRPGPARCKHRTLSDDAIGDRGPTETNVVAWRDVWWQGCSPWLGCMKLTQSSAGLCWGTRSLAAASLNHGSSWDPSPPSAPRPWACRSLEIPTGFYMRRLCACSAWLLFPSRRLCFQIFTTSCPFFTPDCRSRHWVGDTVSSWLSLDVSDFYPICNVLRAQICNIIVRSFNKRKIEVFFLLEADAKPIWMRYNGHIFDYVNNYHLKQMWWAVVVSSIKSRKNFWYKNILGSPQNY